mmetsp:Transcript_10392/g.15127  ORF Transcript_10392/g.15127 Transcript_10392/m.15127 type:complete len:88 (-) Transcript_10392:21-284(-)
MGCPCDLTSHSCVSVTAGFSTILDMFFSPLVNIPLSFRLYATLSWHRFRNRTPMAIDEEDPRRKEYKSKNPKQPQPDNAPCFAGASC